jgi:hypothetical protein
MYCDASKILFVQVCSTWSVPSTIMCMVKPQRDGRAFYLNKGPPVWAWIQQSLPWRTLHFLKIAELNFFFLVIPGGNLLSITRTTVKNNNELFKKRNARLPLSSLKSLSACYSYVWLPPATWNTTVEVFTAQLIDLGNTLEGGFFSRKIERVVSQKEILSYHSSCNALFKRMPPRVLA